MGFVQRIRNLGRRDKVDAEIAAELRAHLSMAAEEMVRKGMSEQEARRAARLKFGNPVIVRETTMDSDAILALDGLGRDVKFALRQLRKSPGFAATVIATLALGIGANTTVFSIVDAVLLRPLPYHQPQRLVEVQSSDVGQVYEGSDVSYPDFFDWRTQNHSFEQLVSYHDSSLTLTGVERAVHLDGEVVSADLLPLLGIRPQMGRGFSAADEKQGTRVALISHELWVSQFGADPGIVGRTLHLSGDAFTVIGVMPASFRFPVTAPKNSFWTTLAVDNDPHNPKPVTASRGTHYLNVMGRLKRGVTVAQADAEMKAIAARLAKQYPDTNTRHNSAQVQEELKVLLGDTRTLLLVVLGAVGLVLLVACGNIANLLLARMREREREIAVRSALGAARVRIVRQLMAESLVLGMAGGLAGCLLALVATPLVLRVLPSGVPRADDAGVNLMVLGFALGISLLCGLLFGTIPAVMAARSNLLETLQSGGRAQIAGHDWLRSAVIVGQVALGIVLTASAGLLLTSFLKLTHANEGFNPDHLLTFQFETPDSRYKDSRPQFYQQYFEKLRALPGVEAASGSMFMPMGDNEGVLSFENPEQPAPPGQQSSAELDLIAPEFFHTMQIPLLAGRDFSDADDVKAAQVMIVNEAFAQKFFHGENPLGRKLKPGAGNESSNGPAWRTIVGVVGNVRRNATDRDLPPIQYLPAGQLSHWCCLYTVARTAVDPMSLEPDARKLITSMDADIPVTDVRTMRDLIGLQLAQPRFAMVLLATFAGLALVLTLVGLYGVMTYSVARRTREIGVRLALGASRGTVMQMVLRHAAVLVGAGMAIGIAVTLASASVLRSMLYGTGERNPAVLVVVCLIVAGTGLLAAYLPALRASGIQPMQALRAE
jgi:putative ABC transport system permease protein